MIAIWPELAFLQKSGQISKMFKPAALVQPPMERAFLLLLLPLLRFARLSDRQRFEFTSMSKSFRLESISVLDMFVCTLTAEELLQQVP